MSPSSSACATSSAPGTRVRIVSVPTPGGRTPRPSSSSTSPTSAPCTSAPSTSRTSRVPTACASSRRARSSALPNSCARRCRPSARRCSDVRRSPDREPRGLPARVVRDRPVLRRGADAGAGGEVQPEPAVRADARGARGRRDRRRCGRLPVRDGGSGRDRPLRGRHCRRRLSDAPPPRRASRDDARADRRRPRSRRADRGALGFRGDDLRTLRLRDGVVHRRDLARTRALRVRAPVRAARTQYACSSRTRRSSSFPPIWERALQQTPGDVQARAPVVGEPGRARSAGAPRRRRPEALRAARARRRGAGLRDLPAQPEVGGRLVGCAARRRRGDRGDTARRPRRSGASCSTSTGRRRSAPTCCRSTTRSSSCSPSRDG